MIFIPIIFLLSFITNVTYVIVGNISFSKISRILILISLLFQTFLILSDKVSIDSKNFEINLFVSSWIVGIASTILLRFFIKNLYTLFISPACFLLSIPLVFAPETNGSFFSNKILAFHVMSNFISHTIILISSIVAILYIYQHTNIKNKIINKIDRLPSLSSMEKIIFLLICIAFPIMTIGFGLGFILSKEQIGTYWFGSVSAISIISWTIFFLIIQVKAFFSLSGLKISYYSLVGFISIILGYIAMYSLKLPSHTFISMGS